jgi:hypothetical protein
MPYYLGYTSSNRREIIHLSQRPTREKTGGRYKRCRGPLTLIGAHYLKYREENGHLELPEMTGAQLEARALTDEDTHWQDILAVISDPDECDINALEAAEYNPDLHPEAAYPLFLPEEVNHV